MTEPNITSENTIHLAVLRREMDTLKEALRERFGGLDGRVDAVLNRLNNGLSEKINDILRRLIRAEDCMHRMETDSIVSRLANAEITIKELAENRVKNLEEELKAQRKWRAGLIAGIILLVSGSFVGTFFTMQAKIAQMEQQIQTRIPQRGPGAGGP